MSRKLLLIVGAVSIGIIAVVAFVFLRGKSNEVS